MQPTTALAPTPAEAVALIIGPQQTQAIVRRGRDRQIVCVKANVVLSERLGHLHRIEGKYSLSAAGWNVINKLMGVSFPPIQTILGDDGKSHPNPWIETHDNGAIRRVTVLAVGIGYDAMGNRMCHSETIRFDLSAYLQRDLFVKWQGAYDRQQGNRGKPKEWGRLVNRLALGEIKTDRETTRVVHIDGETALVVDLTHPDVHNVYRTHTQKLLFAERNAVTIARSRVLKRFSDVGIPDVKDGTATIPVMGWVSDDREYEDWAKIAESIEAGRPPDDAPRSHDVSEPIDADFETLGESPPEEPPAASEEPDAAPAASPEFEPSPPELDALQGADPPEAQPPAAPGPPQAATLKAKVALIAGIFKAMPVGKQAKWVGEQLRPKFKVDAPADLNRILSKTLLDSVYANITEFNEGGAGF